MAVSSRVSLIVSAGMPRRFRCRRDRRAAPRGRTAALAPCRCRRSCRSRSDSRDRRARGFPGRSARPAAGRRRSRAPAAALANNSRTKSGDRPSEGSSSSRMSGFDISARPIATICCSPPLMVRTICGSRSLRRGNSDSTCWRRAASLSRARFGLAPEQQVFRDRQFAENAAAFRHRAPGPPRRSRAPAAAERSRPESVDPLAGQARHDAGDGLHQRGLAGAIGAEDDDDLAAADAERRIAQRAVLAIGDADGGDLKHRPILRDRLR